MTKNNTRMLDELAVVTSPTTTFSSLGGGSKGRFRGQPSNKGQFAKGTTSSVEIGFRHPIKAKIAGWHHSGREGINKMPARPFLGLEKEWVERNVSQEFQKMVNMRFGADGAGETITMRLM